MRTLCDACESAAALVFCAADEAALCRACDEKVHMCNKLASRHVRVGLANPNNAPRCDICENASAFFYCETDGSSLCLECDVIVHVGAKRKHIRYLLLRQRIEFPGDKPVQAEQQGQAAGETCRNGQNKQNHDQVISPDRKLESNSDGQRKMDSEMIDLNLQPHRNDE